MKQLKTLCALAAVMIVLIAGYFIVSSLTAEETPAETPDETITLTAFDYESAVRIDYTDEGESYALELENTKWYWADDHALPLNQTAVWQMVNAASALTSTRRVDDNETDTAAFGLDSPAHDITVTLADGSAYHLELGDYNTFASAYYLRYEGAVYLVDSAISDYFGYAPIEMLAADTLPVITDGEGALTSVTTLEGEITDSAALAAVYSAYSALKTEVLVDYNAEPAELDAFGLADADRREIKIAYNEKLEVTDSDGSISSSIQKAHEITLRIGLSSGGYTYFSFDDSAMVFAAADDTVSAFLTACGM